MIPVMAMPAQMQMYSFFKITKSTLFAGMMILLLGLFPFRASADAKDFSEGLLIPGYHDRDTLEIPETLPPVSPADTMPVVAQPAEVLMVDTLVSPVDTITPLVTTETEEAILQADEYYPQIKEHSPLKATMLSATLPGLGQAYNGKYWKIPFFYAFIGGTVYAVDFNNKQYQHFRKNWVARIDGNPNTQDEYPNVATDRLQREMNRWRRNVEVSYIVGAAIYILNILDATVDAHLLDFDVGEDLTLNVMPVVIPQNSTFGNRMNQVSPGIRLSFRF